MVSADRLAGLAGLTARLGRCDDLDATITESLDALAHEFGYEHSMLMMVDETGERLYTIASRGYEREGVGSEVDVGDGIIGMAAARRIPMRVANLQRMVSYARQVRGSVAPDDVTEIPLPGLASARSQVAVPASVMGQVIGVLAVESEQVGAFTREDEDLLGVVAHLVGAAIELDRIGDRAGARPRGEPAPNPVATDVATRAAKGRDQPTAVRFFPADGSTFVEGEYLIKGVPGRILWRLLREHHDEGRTEFTNREVRLDPSLELPAFRDNLESRLILLKRRLDERAAPMRIRKTGRGRFRLEVDGVLVLDRVDA